MVCRLCADNATLVRVVRLPDAHWVLGSGRGRGVWLHRDCVSDLVVRHLASSLRASVSGSELEEVRRLVK